MVARAENELHGLTLEKIGADQVVYPERESGERLAYSLAYSGVRDYLRLQEGYGVSRVYPPREFQGRTIDEVGLGPRSDSGLTVLGVVRGRDIILTPDRFERIRDGDVLVVAGLTPGCRAWTPSTNARTRSTSVRTGTIVPAPLYRRRTRHIIAPPRSSRPVERTL